MNKALLVAGVVIAAMPSTAFAQKVQSGTKNGISYTATSRIVGRDSTGTVASGGNPAYLAQNSKGYSGSVGILMTYSSGAQFVCSGTLLNDRRSVLTAGHCVSDGGGTKSSDLVRTQVIFANDAVSNSDAGIYALPAGTVAVDVGRYIVNQNYTGEVIDQNDIAILKLNSYAPSFAQTYEIYTGDLTGATFNVNGYGTRSVIGGAEGYTGPGAGAGVGRRRQGNNIYDYAWGNDVFDGFFTDRDANGENFFGTAEVQYSYISDFDNFRPQNDASCLIGVDVGGLAAVAAGFCQTGIDLEVGIAGGDSGGGAFINGQIASVNSYGLSFGASYGDFKPGLQSSWGEFSGYVPTNIHQGFINAGILAGVPEPTTWAMMILGMGAVGGAMRRRNAKKTTIRFA